MAELLVDGGGVLDREYIDQALLARVTAPKISGEPQVWAPEETGAFSIPREVWGAAGHKLPEVARSLADIERLRQSDSPLGYLASKASISLATGCWSIVDAWRDAKGYSYSWNPAEFGIEPRSKREFRAMRLHQIAYILRKREEDPEFVLPPRTPLDHRCRFPGCCADHAEEVTLRENNIRQQLAHKIETVLALGQQMIGSTGYNWLDDAVEAAEEEQTGIVVNTRFGPVGILKLDDDPLLIGTELIEDELLLKLREKAPDRYKRPSRAKKPRALRNQKSLIHHRKFKKENIPNIDELYAEAMGS